MLSPVAYHRSRRLPTPRTPQSAYSFTSYSAARRTPRAATVVIESILKQLRAMAVYGRAVYTILQEAERGALQTKSLYISRAVSYSRETEFEI